MANSPKKLLPIITIIIFIIINIIIITITDLGAEMTMSRSSVICLERWRASGVRLLHGVSKGL